MNEFILPVNGGQSDVYDELMREFLNNRTLVFNDDVDDNVIENYIMHILRWNKEDIGLPIHPNGRYPLSSAAVLPSVCLTLQWSTESLPFSFPFQRRLRSNA